jgi:hypothetical protein
LASVRDLTHQVRIAQRGTWFPLLVFAVITLGSIPLYRYGPRHVAACVSGQAPAGQVSVVCGAVRPWTVVYWPVALVLAYVAIAAFYVRQSRRRGVGTRIRPYLVVGVVFAVLVSAASLWGAYHPSIPHQGVTPLTEVGYRLQSSVAAIGVALLVLAWVERNRLLAWFSLVYLIVVLVPGGLLPGGTSLPVRHSSPWDFLPRVLVTAGVLLMGSLGFAMYGRDAQRGAR